MNQKDVYPCLILILLIIISYLIYLNISIEINKEKIKK